MINIKITIQDILSDEEDEIVFKVRNLDDRMLKLIAMVKAEHENLVCSDGDSICMVPPGTVFYFESVDNKTFVYCESSVYEIKMKLYELERRFEQTDFIRISKSVIVNINRIQKLFPSFNGRFEALLSNDERLIISRQYLPDLKKKLGIGV